MTSLISVPDRISVAALLVAAGRGLRAGLDIPKQYLDLAGETMLTRSIRALAADKRVKQILCVIHPDDRARYDEAIEPLPSEIKTRLVEPTFGGATRQESGKAGLEALAVSDHPPDIILVHDAARPFASEALIARSIESAYLKGAAIPGISVIDTIKKTDLSGIITSTPPRRDLRAVQTPQAFKFDILLKAHRSALSAKDIEFTDDASIAEWAGHKVHIFEGEPENIKVTTPEDVSEARQRLSGPRDVRTGIGYDVHAFEEGDHVILGGVRIPFTKKLKGHSDADVGLHALTDAIYGALAEGDIGSHFPPSDGQWKNADSALFLRHAVDRVKARGGVIKHLDLTLICEAPKIGPHRDAIRTRIAELCGVKISRVGVKATTTEQLGFTGRGEGIAAQAIATIELPDLA